MKKRRVNRHKKGVTLTLETILLIVLTVMAVTILTTFFLTSSGNFMEKINTYFTQDNVDSVIKACNILADSGQEYSFCCDKKEVKYFAKDEKGNEVKTKSEFTCQELVNKDFIGEKIKRLNCGGIKCLNEN